MLQIVLIVLAVAFCAIGIIYFISAVMRKNGFAYAEQGFLAQNQNEPGFADYGIGSSFGLRVDQLLIAHARRINISFYFSLLLATIGLVMALFVLVSAASTSLNGSLMGLASGFLVELVAIAFFLNSLRAQREIGELLRAERDERQTGELADLLAQMSDVQRRDQLIAQLVMRRSASIPARSQGGVLQSHGYRV